MHKVMVGIHEDCQNNANFFGYDEVNELIRRGMTVVAIEPGDRFQIAEDNASTSSMVWYVTIVLNDYGIDPTQPSTTSAENGETSVQKGNSPNKIPW